MIEQDISFESDESETNYDFHRSSSDSYFLSFWHFFVYLKTVL